MPTNIPLHSPAENQFKYKPQVNEIEQNSRIETFFEINESDY